MKNAFFLNKSCLQPYRYDFKLSFFSDPLRKFYMSYNNVDALTKHLNDSPESVEFGDVIALIDSAFTFTPTAFTNGEVTNDANQNNGSCKLLALGQHLQLSQGQTLALFGGFYRDDVLKNPDGDDHANIRNFMQSGHEGVSFEAFPLSVKS